MAITPLRQSYLNPGLTLRHAEAQLCIQVDVVVPGQPEAGAQLAVRQRHHLREAGGEVIHLATLLFPAVLQHV